MLISSNLVLVEVFDIAQSTQLLAMTDRAVNSHMFFAGYCGFLKFNKIVLFLCFVSVIFFSAQASYVTQVTLFNTKFIRNYIRFKCTSVNDFYSLIVYKRSFSKLYHIFSFR